jgi:hypothetical protein
MAAAISLKICNFFKSGPNCDSFCILISYNYRRRVVNRLFVISNELNYQYISFSIHVVLIRMIIVGVIMRQFSENTASYLAKNSQDFSEAGSVSVFRWEERVRTMWNALGASGESLQCLR